jgi:hypothetical protein
MQQKAMPSAWGHLRALLRSQRRRCGEAWCRKKGFGAMRLELEREVLCNVVPMGGCRSSVDPDAVNLLADVRAECLTCPCQDCDLAGA